MEIKFVHSPHTPFSTNSLLKFDACYQSFEISKTTNFIAIYSARVFEVEITFEFLVYNMQVAIDDLAYPAMSKI